MTDTLNLPREFGQVYGRRIRREERDVMLSFHGQHRRRAFIVRAGILVGFAFSMVIYPIMGTLSPSATAVDFVPGVLRGDTPATAAVVLGEAPGLVESELPPPSVEDAARAIALEQEIIVSSYLPDCSGSSDWEGTNGNIDRDYLCEVWDGYLLRSDAAVALAYLNHLFELEFGRNMCISSSYRSYGEQVAIKVKRGDLAATPGQSNHGWGLAIDLCRSDYLGAPKEWLEANGPAYGWINPSWAKTSLWEPWHYEYEPGRLALPWHEGEEE